MIVIQKWTWKYLKMAGSEIIFWILSSTSEEVLRKIYPKLNQVTFKNK